MFPLVFVNSVICQGIADVNKLWSNYNALYVNIDVSHFKEECLCK